MAPFIHPDGRTLYFSSRGHTGMGAADLFVSRLGPDNRWQKPENLGYPVNTKHDEINLIINAKGDEAYISAERDNGFGHTDIYRFELPQQVRPASVSYVHGKVFDKANLQPLAAIFELIDMQSNRSIINSVSDGISGEFLLCLPVNKEYALNVSCKGYLFSSLNFSLGKGNDSLNPKNIDIPMQAVEVGKKVVLRNIFFETDKCELLPESKAELGKLVEFLTNNPTLRIEISGHTDDQGSDAYNLTLSENRARAVNDYLLKQGIDAARLTYQGYGESLPIDTNTTPEGRANNRRTEFKVVTK
jgi:outer membrane protein OmpA-like peptidoglycan-associated protein